MFNKLTDLKYKRDTKQAFGFYVAYLIGIILLAMVSAAVLGVATGNQDNFQFGLRVGTFVAILSCLGLSFAILQKKKLLQNFGFILLALVSGVLALFGGAIVGLIPVAYFTTRK
jgi:hypothetical protein